MTGLETIKYLREDWRLREEDWIDKHLDVLEKELKEKEKQDKAIEIIIRKDVAHFDILVCNNYEAYKFHTQEWDKEWVLTQEEFDLLKEVFDNE